VYLRAFNYTQKLIEKQESEIMFKFVTKWTDKENSEFKIKIEKMCLFMICFHLCDVLASFFFLF
jgi:hypothetical protein